MMVQAQPKVPKSSRCRNWCLVPLGAGKIKVARHNTGHINLYCFKQSHGREQALTPELLGVFIAPQYLYFTIMTMLLGY